MIAVLTGPVRSGKSGMALDLAADHGGPVVVAVGGREDDTEMERRIAAHRAARPACVTVIEAGADVAWVADVPSQSCLVVDCLGTILGRAFVNVIGEDATLAPGEVEATAQAAADALVSALLSRDGDTVVVTNEVGWGVVPAFPAGRLFRDVIGRANRALVDAADGAWLIVAGRAIDLKQHTKGVGWPVSRG